MPLQPLGQPNEQNRNDNVCCEISICMLVFTLHQLHVIKHCTASTEFRRNSEKVYVHTSTFVTCFRGILLNPQIYLKVRDKSRIAVTTSLKCPTHLYHQQKDLPTCNIWRMSVRISRWTRTRVVRMFLLFNNLFDLIWCMTLLSIMWDMQIYLCKVKLLPKKMSVKRKNTCDFFKYLSCIWSLSLGCPKAVLNIRRKWHDKGER